MVLVDAIIVLVVVGVLVLVGAKIVSNGQKAPAIEAKRDQRELANAVRLLGEVLAVDDAVPQIPIPLKNRIQTCVNSYYKELEAK